MKLIVWLPLLLKALGNMGIVIICCPVYDVINFVIKLGFLIRSFPYMIKKVNINMFRRLFSMN